MDKKFYEICNVDDNFPQKLKDIKPVIKKLYAMGDINLLSKKSMAIVGSRNSSEYGRDITKKITKELVENDIVIVSGMAVGIDSIAHNTCIENGGKTIAVLGSGFKNIYPKENTKLFYKIIETGGLILSEYAIDEAVQAKNFPKRNRIVSGISNGVLVIEGAYRSGTSITAKNAIIQGKKVFCVPNCIGNKNSYSCINLAKKGAITVTCGADILTELEIKTENSYDIHLKNNVHKLENILNKMDNDSKKIFLCMKENGSLNCDEISLKTNIDVVKVNQTLTYMELEDIIVNTGINKYKVKEEFCE